MSLRPITAKLNMARRTVLKRDTVREVLLGDANGQADPPEIGYHWVRLPTGADASGNASYGAPFRVRANPAGGYLPRAGRRVFIALRNGAWVVQGPSLDDLEQAGIDARSLIAGTPEQAYIYLSDVVNLNALDLMDGLIVAVRELIYEINRVIKIWRGTDATLHVDLTPYPPTDVDTHLFALLVFNITKHLADVYPLEVYPGTAISLFTELGEADLQTCYDALPPDQAFFAIKAFYLQYGQTEIAGPAYDVDVRQFINVPQPLVIPDDFITTDMIQDAAITLPKLANDVLHLAAVAPTINDDSAHGYAVGSEWFDTLAKKAYVCVDATVGAAVWKETTLPTGTGTVTSVGVSTDASYLEVGSSPVTGSGVITVNKKNGLTQNQVIATPDGSNGKADLRALVANDIPSLPASKIGSGTLASARGGLGADASSFTAILKMITGVASAAVAGTDYITPSGAENVSNKTITASSLVATALSLILGGFKAIFTHANSADRTYTWPDVSGTVTLNAAAQTLSSKTLSSPVINTGVSGTAIDTDPTLGANSDTLLASQKAIKSYVDAIATGLSVKYSVLAATTAALPANTYSNGTSGVGATITANAVGTLTIDGQAIALNDRVLIKDESSASHNGIYICTTAGSGGAAFVLTRVADMNQATEISGAFTFVENGTANDGAGFVVADPGPFTIGTTAINWTQFSGAGEISVTAPLSKTGNNISLTTPLSTTYGGSGANMSATGGANFFLKQLTVGGAFTAALMVLADIPNTLITLAKMAAGTPGKIMGYDSSSAAAEIDRASDDIVAVWGEPMSLNASVIRRNSDDRWYKEDTDDSTRLGALRGIVVDLGVSAGATASTGFVRRLGPIGGQSGLTNGDTLYATTTAGVLSQMLPTPTLDGAVVVVAPHGYATGTTTAYINALQEIIYRQFVTVAAAGIISLTHYSDPSFARRVQVRQVIYTDILTDTYASSNQDTNVSLRGPAGSTTTIDNTGASGTFIGNNGGVIRRMAQSFSVTTAQRLIEFTIEVGVSPNALLMAGMTWRIETDNTDKPSGTAIASGSVSSLTAPAISGTVTNTIPITGYPLLAASTKYWFVMTSVTITTNFYYTININASGGYASGSMKSDTFSGGSYPGTWAGGGGTNDMRSTFTTSTSDGLAQSFTAAQTKAVTRLRLWLKKTGSPIGTLTPALYSNNAGVPGTLITNGTAVSILASALTASYAYYDFLYYVPPPALTSGTIYHIVLLTSDAASSTNYVEWGADTSSPSFTGDMSVLIGSTWNVISPAADAVFEVYGRDTAFISEMPLSDYNTGTAGYGLTLGDSSGANQDTITRIKNLGLPRELYINLTLP